MSSEILLIQDDASTLPFLSKLYIWSVQLHPLLFFYVAHQNLFGIGGNISKILEFIVCCALFLSILFYSRQSFVVSFKGTSIYWFFILYSVIVGLFGFAFGYYHVDSIIYLDNIEALSSLAYLRPISDYIIAMNGVYLVPNMLNLSSNKGEIISSIHMNYAQAIIDTDKRAAEWNKYQITLEKSVNVRRFVESNKNLEECRLLDIPVNSVIPPGINLNQFYPRKDWDELSSSLRIALFCHPRSHKGLSDGIKVVEKIKKKYSTNSIVFSTLGDVADFNVSMFDHHFGYLLKDEYPKALRIIDILIYPELFGGFSVPPLHAMASGCAVVLNKIDGVDLYGRDQENCMLSNPGDIDKMAENVGIFIENNKFRNKIGLAAIDTAVKFGWSNSARILTKFLKKE